AHSPSTPPLFAHPTLFRSELLVPARGHDLGLDPVTLADPPVHVGGPPPVPGHADGAVERHPRHELPVDERPAAAARLPDPLVGVVPVLAQPVDDVDDVRPAVVADAPVAERTAVEGVDRVERLAVDVELQLVGGAVAHPHGPGPHVAVEMVERLLVEVRAAVDPVHDPERAGAVAGSLVE